MDGKTDDKDEIIEQHEQLYFPQVWGGAASVVQKCSPTRSCRNCTDTIYELY